MAANGGLITKEDLAKYSPVIRKPIHGNYRGYDIHSMPPPSSGGVHIVQILNLLEPFPISYLGHNTADTIHLMAEAMKPRYCSTPRTAAGETSTPCAAESINIGQQTAPRSCPANRVNSKATIPLIFQ